MSTRRTFLGGAFAAATTLPLPATARIDARPRTGNVQTVLGPISGERMGFTAPHEHVLASSTNFMRLWPEYLGGRERFTSGAAERMKAAKAAGIDTIVDCITADLGRDVRLLQEVSRRSGVQIIAVTGHWLTPTPSFEARSADELADFFSLEIERGIENTAIRPGVIKAASEGDGMTPFQEKVFRAAARASKRTGVPVTTHSDARHQGANNRLRFSSRKGSIPEWSVLATVTKARTSIISRDWHDAATRWVSITSSMACRRWAAGQTASPPGRIGRR